MTTILFCTEEEALPDIEIGDAVLIGVEDLCEAPRQIVSLVSDDEKELVLAVHGDRLQLGALQAAARRLGFDPLSLGLARPGVGRRRRRLSQGCGGHQSASLPIPGISARTGETPVSRSIHPPRASLSIGTPTYVAAPAIEHEICVAGDGCRVCVSGCPAGALSWDGGVIANDKTSCVACGICVTSCPTGAVVNPILTPDAIEAEISAAIGYRSDPIGIRYRCREALVGSEHGWHQVEVPCTGMLTVGWLLAPLVMGAKEVDAVPCSAGGCSPWQRRSPRGDIGDAATVWHELGFELDASTSIDHQTHRDGRQPTIRPRVDDRSYSASLDSAPTAMGDSRRGRRGDRHDRLRCMHCLRDVCQCLSDRRSPIGPGRRMCHHRFRSKVMRRLWSMRLGLSRDRKQCHHHDEEFRPRRLGNRPTRDPA